jgi:diguanylate cyclase (GGDEF)-like protein
MTSVDTGRPSLDDTQVLADLPTLSAVGFEILRVSRDPDATIDDLSQVIQRDPALSLRVTSLANSPAYLRREPVTTVKDAALLLGRQAVSIVALSFSIAGSLDRTGCPAGLNLEHYWQRSLTTATIARHLQRAVAPAQAEQAFLAGLLAHIGKLVLAQKATSFYGDVVERAGGWPSLALEEELLGWTSLEVTLAVLREWNIAEELVSAIEFGVDPSRRPAAERMAELAEVIALAIAADTSLHDPDNIEGHRLLEARFTAVFEDEQVFTGLDQALAEASQMMDITLPDDLRADDLLTQARQGMLAATLSMATENYSQSQRIEDVERENRELAERASSDGLTGLPNRRTFDEAVTREAARRACGGVAGAFGLMMLDLDHFKALNDTYGHAFGDEVLRQVARAMESAVRQDEVLYRYGGEEFVLLAPSCDRDGLAVAGERLRRVVEGLELSCDGRPVSVTLSGGAACAAAVQTVEDAAIVMERADVMLYRAKKEGRNRVMVSGESEI